MDVILLDNQSTQSFFGNPKMVQDIQESEEVLELSTNGGTIIVNQIAILPGYGKVWFYDKAITNILSFAEVANKYPIEYKHENHKFVVHVSANKKPSFKRSLIQNSKDR